MSARKRKSSAGDRGPTRAQAAKARRELAAQGIYPGEPGDPEVGEVLNEVMARLGQAADVATVVARALAHEFGPGSIPLRLSRALEHSCARVLGEQRKQIQRVIDGASFAGPRLVINSNKLKAAERERRS